MTLAADTELGSYRIEALIGQGGMGQVYLARDTALDRPVAIKVLPESFASNPERVARFEREARLLATLSHQNIGGIYGLEEADGMRYLVLELVEGRTLKDHLASGPCPVEETLRLCRQVADALAAAHDKGVIHRDLKPGNIMITHDDTVKVLDFGIAKALDPTGSATSLAEGRTWSVDHQTAAGTMVGTPAYMSPEQARGKTIDKRSDIWSFGCVLYECLTGELTFGAETVTDTLARILEREPDFTRVPMATPPTIQTLLRRCLQKDRKKRLHDIADARVQIDEAIADPQGSTLGLSGAYMAVDHKESRSSKAPWIVAAVFAVVAVATWAWPRTARHVQTPVSEPLRLAWLTPDVDVEWDKGNWDLAPHGARLVYVARPIAAPDTEKPVQRLYIRDGSTFESVAIPDTAGASKPAFSPSGQWIAFMTQDKTTGRVTLKRVALDGSPPISVFDATDRMIEGYVWLSEDALMVSENGPAGHKSIIAVESGRADKVEFDTSSLGEFVNYEITDVLPGGTHALGNTWRVLGSRVQVTAFIVDLDNWACRKLLDDAGVPRYAASGHLVFARERNLMAAPFDASSGQVTGRVLSLISGVGRFDLSSTGELVYYPVLGRENARRLMRVDPVAGATPMSAVRRPFQYKTVASPDGRWLALVTFDFETMLPRIWIHEIDSGLMRPLTPSDQVSLAPVFSNDGEQVAFMKWDPATPGIAIMPTSGVQDPRTVCSFELGSGWINVNAWLPDDSGILATQFSNHNNDSNIVRIDIESGAISPVLASTARELDARLSPDGRWLIYSSNRTGLWSVLLRSYDPASDAVGPATEITSKYDSIVGWSPDGTRIYYIDNDEHLIAVTITTDPELVVSAPETILDIEPLRAVDGNITLLRDGGFAMIQKGEQELEARHLNIVLNWYDDLRRKVPAQDQAVAGR